MGCTIRRKANEYGGRREEISVGGGLPAEADAADHQFVCKVLSPTELPEAEMQRQRITVASIAIIEVKGCGLYGTPLHFFAHINHKLAEPEAIYRPR